MRSVAALAACFVSLAIYAGVVAACGGPTFTSVSPGPDGGGPPGAGGSTDAAASDAGGSFCAVEAGAHTFCDDFDGLPLASKWSSIDQSGGTAAIDSTKAYSRPNSFESIAPAGIGETHGRVVESFPTSASKVVVAFALWIDSAPPKAVTTAGGDSLIGISVGPSYTVGLNAHAQLGYFEDDTSVDGSTTVLNSGNLGLTSTLETGWTEVVITVDIAHASLSITIGGQPQLSGLLITPPTGQTTLSVTLGAYVHDEIAELAAHFDNVTIDLTP